MPAERPGRKPPLQGPEADLQALGFSEYEARIYLTLLRLKPATAYELSKAAGVPRSNTYSTLESLTKKAAVQPVSQQPTRYVPVDPDEVFGRIARETGERCQALVTQLDHLRTDYGTDFVWSIAGEKDVHEKISEMMAGARQHIWIKAPEDVLERHLDDLKKAADRGVALVIILFGSDPSRFCFGESSKVYLHEGNGVRIGIADNLFTVAIDFEAALTANIYGNVYGTYTQSQPIVTTAESLIRHDVYLSEIFERFGAQIDEAFGPYLLALRRKYFSAEQLAATREKLAEVDPEALAALDAPPRSAPLSPRRATRRPARR